MGWDTSEQVIRYLNVFLDVRRSRRLQGLTQVQLASRKPLKSFVGGQESSSDVHLSNFLVY